MAKKGSFNWGAFIGWCLAIALLVLIVMYFVWPAFRTAVGGAEDAVRDKIANSGTGGEEAATEAVRMLIR
ncbi:MAG: hypothetical protein IJ542_02590 [Clostridia bacterium]|nr:hypothetical protein [Clostridia bacterium]